LLQKP